MTVLEPTPSVESCRKNLLFACSNVYDNHVAEMSRAGNGYYCWRGQTSSGIGIQMMYCPPKEVGRPPRKLPNSDITVSFHPPQDHDHVSPTGMVAITRGKPEVILHPAFGEGMGELNAPSTTALTNALTEMCAVLEAL